jgi:hypothetical protein
MPTGAPHESSRPRGINTYWTQGTPQRSRRLRSGWGENVENNRVGDATCTLAQLPYTLPLQYYKYLFQYVVDCRNNIPNNYTTPLTPAIIFAGQRASARGLPGLRYHGNGTSRKGQASRLRTTSGEGRTRGISWRTHAPRCREMAPGQYGSVVAGSDRAIRIRDVSTPFGWKAKDSIAPIRACWTPP